MREPISACDAIRSTAFDWTLGATVVINLVVGGLDRGGNLGAGDRVDRWCRWIFPITYFGLISVMVGVGFAFFQ